MLWTLLLVLLIMWALGLGFGVAGNLIHIILVVALVLLVVQLLSGRKVV
ncbi:MAG: lmo0937 family membrane protein [Pirellulales bacterium]|nr:lmo0937 family membrane protein [Pirellulales bacterium]